MKKIFIAVVAIVFLLITFTAAIFYFNNKDIANTVGTRIIEDQTGINLNSTPSAIPTEYENDIEVVAENLTVPWEIVFLPDNSMLVTERDGTLLRIDQETEIIQEIEGVRHVGEGGLLGLALHPNYEDNNYIYLYLTSTNSNGSIINRVERYTFTNNQLSNRTVILDNILGASNHDGGRIKFSPDNKLYITTGDAGNTSLSQNTSSLNGKILRINDDGSIPEDNPFNNEIYSYGHRNAQGLAWDGNGKLWATEHGRSGIQSGFDEINLIEIGKNYGWPTIQGDDIKANMVSPVIHSGSSTTWAPSGMAIIADKIYFSGLRGQALYEATIIGNTLTNLKTHFKNQYGRIRAVVAGPDNYLYITTSNTDGRGNPDSTDDKIIRINPQVLN